MGTLRRDERRALEEAAAWFMRLKQDRVSAEAIDAFFVWRAKPLNGAAYAEVEGRMRQAERLRNDPELVQMTEAVLRRPRRTTQLVEALRRPFAPFAFVSLTLAVAVVALSLALQGPSYSTQVGAQQVVRLDDGSVVRLNTDSKVLVRYGPKVRRLVLQRGEAYFEVARDETRPFVVEAGAARVRALGTKFDVRRMAGQTHVTLLEGRVEVGRGGGSNALTLQPHEQVTVNQDRLNPRPVDVAQVTSWTTGRLRFVDTPLASAVAEVNRYSRMKILLDASEVEQVRINGVFDAGDTNAFVSAVTELFSLTAVRTTRGVVLRADEFTTS
jgi:transmembrane sensor